MYLYSATILDQMIFPFTCHFQQPNIIPIHIWLNIVIKISFVFAFGHFRKMNAICIRIQPKIWIRIIFVLVFSSENTISLPLPQQMVPSPLDCKANNICTHIHARIHIYVHTHTCNRVTQEIFHSLKTNNYYFLSEWLKINSTR